MTYADFVTAYDRRGRCGTFDEVGCDVARKRDENANVLMVTSRNFFETALDSSGVSSRSDIDTELGQTMKSRVSALGSPRKGVGSRNEHLGTPCLRARGRREAS